MATQLQIVNLALTRLGVPRITSMTDGSKAALSATAVWELVRDEVLSKHPWNRTTSRADLRRTTDAAKIISGVSAASDAVITTTKPHGYRVGEVVLIVGVEGCLDSTSVSVVNGIYHPVIAVTATTFTISVDTTVASATAYVADGLAMRVRNKRLGELGSAIATAAAASSCVEIQTAAEAAAGVTPTNICYEPGDVRRYGAVGDGTTDDTVAIQAAFSAASASGGAGVVFPRKGPWKSGRIDVSGSCSVRGPATINLVGSDASAYQWLRFTASFTGFLAESITVVGSNTEAHSQYGFGPTSSAVVVTDASFINCSVRDVIVGIDATAMNGCEVSGGRIGPTLGNASGRGYGVVFGSNSLNCRSVGVHYYRCSRHSLYMAHTKGGVATGNIFREHGFGATPGQFSALAMARGQSNSATGNSFIDCVHNPVEIVDTDSESGQYEGFTFSGNVFRGCKLTLIVGEANATVNANQSTVAGAIVGNTWHMPAASAGECIRVFQALALNITGNTFYFPSETVSQTPITLDDVATDYPSSVLLSGNAAHLNTTHGTKSLVYLDTNLCGSGSNAKITVVANEVFGSTLHWIGAAEMQNANFKSDAVQEKAVSSGTTPYVSGYRNVAVSHGGATNVTDFLGSYDGQEIQIAFTNANVTLVDAAGLQLAGGVNFVGSSDDILTLRRRGSVWYEVSRSVN